MCRTAQGYRRIRAVQARIADLNRKGAKAAKVLYGCSVCARCGRRSKSYPSRPLHLPRTVPAERDLVLGFFLFKSHLGSAGRVVPEAAAELSCSVAVSVAVRGRQVSLDRREVIAEIAEFRGQHTVDLVEVDFPVEVDDAIAEPSHAA